MPCGLTQHLHETNAPQIGGPPKPDDTSTAITNTVRVSPATPQATGSFNKSTLLCSKQHDRDGPTPAASGRFFFVTAEFRRCSCQPRRSGALNVELSKFANNNMTLGECREVGHSARRMGWRDGEVGGKKSRSRSARPDGPCTRPSRSIAFLPLAPQPVPSYDHTQPSVVRLNDFKAQLERQKA